MENNMPLILREQFTTITNLLIILGNDLMIIRTGDRVDFPFSPSSEFSCLVTKSYCKMNIYLI